MVLPPASADGELAAHIAAVISGSAASPPTQQKSTVLVKNISVGDVIMGYTGKKEATRCTVLAVHQWSTNAWVEGGYTAGHLVLDEPAASPGTYSQNTASAWVPRTGDFKGINSTGKAPPAGNGALYELVSTCPVVVDANGVLAAITNTDTVRAQPPFHKYEDPLKASRNAKRLEIRDSESGEWIGSTAPSWKDYLRVYDAFVLLIAKTGTFWLNPLAWTGTSLDKVGIIGKTASSSYLNCQHELVGDGAGAACQFFEEFVVATVLPALTAEHRATVTSAFPGLVQAPGNLTHAGSTVATIVSSLVEKTGQQVKSTEFAALKGEHGSLVKELKAVKESLTKALNKPTVNTTDCAALNAGVVDLAGVPKSAASLAGSTAAATLAMVALAL